MAQKIIIPVEDTAGLAAKVAQHFGRATYYASVEVNGRGQIVSTKTEKNTGEHMGGSGHPHENLLALQPTVIIAYGMGPGGLQSFRKAGITVLKAEGTTVEEVITNFTQGKLTELTAGCPHAHEHHHT